MTTIDRNPDCNLDAEDVPSDCYLATGKHLMLTARAAKVPYGEAKRRVPCCNSTRIETVGLVIRLTDKERFEAAIEKKSKRQQYA